MNRSVTDGCVTVTVTGMNRFDGGGVDWLDGGEKGNWEGGKWVGGRRKVCVRGRVLEG